MLDLLILGLTVLALILLYTIYLLVLKPLYLIRYYTKQGASGEYYPVFGGFVKWVRKVPETGDFLYFYKNAVQNKKDSPRLFATNLGPEILLFLVDPALIKEFVLKLERNYVRAKEFMGLNRTFLGNGLVNSEGSMWKKHRKIASNAFHFEFLKSQIPVIVSTTKEILDKIADGDLTKVDIMQEFEKITGQITGRIFFEQEFAKVHFNGKLLPQALTGIEGTIFDEQQRIWCNVFGVSFVEAGILPRHKRLMNDIQGVRELCRTLMNKKKEQRAQEKAKGEQEKQKARSLLEFFLDYQENFKGQEQGITDEEIIDDFCAFFIGGTDPTSHLLTMTVYHLTQHLACYQKTLEEAIRYLQNEENLSNENVDKMQYTHCVIKEALRLTTPFPFIIPREALTDHRLKDIKVSKGTRVTLFTTLNCSKSEYFNNPTSFVPERWLPENEESKILNKEPYIYLPFAAGSRNCIGQHLALLEAKIILGMFLRRFEISVPEDYKMKMNMTFMYGPLDRFKLNLKLRNLDQLQQ